MDNLALQLLILALAAWRISSLLVKEDGPFSIFYKIRKMVGISTSDLGVVMSIRDWFPADVLSCVWCTSIYVAALWVLLFFLFPVATFYVALVFALSSATILFNLLVEKLKS